MLLSASESLKGSWHKITRGEEVKEAPFIFSGCFQPRQRMPSRGARPTRFIYGLALEGGWRALLYLDIVEANAWVLWKSSDSLGNAKWKEGQAAPAGGRDHPAPQSKSVKV